MRKEIWIDIPISLIDQKDVASGVLSQGLQAFGRAMQSLREEAEILDNILQPHIEQTPFEPQILPAVQATLDDHAVRGSQVSLHGQTPAEPRTHLDVQVFVEEQIATSERQIQEYKDFGVQGICAYGIFDCPSY